MHFLRYGGFPWLVAKGKYHYTNEELAQSYFTLKMASAAENYSSLNGIRKKKWSIQASPIRISGYYRRHGSLKGLKLKGNNSETISLLELILKNGFERAREIIWGKTDEDLEAFCQGSACEKHTVNGIHLRKIAYYNKQRKGNMD